MNPFFRIRLELRKSIRHFRNTFLLMIQKTPLLKCYGLSTWPLYRVKSFRLPHKSNGNIERLEMEYKALWASHKWDPSKIPIALIDKAKLDLNLALTTQAEKAICLSGNKFYLHANKMGSLMAVKLSPCVRVSTIPKIRIAGQPPTVNPVKILDAFQDF